MRAFKAALRWFLATLGVRIGRVDGGICITRIPAWESAGAGDTVTVKVAGYPLLMLASGYLARIYPAHPTYSSELGRLIATVLSKYPDSGFVDVGASFGDTVAIAKAVADIPVLCFEGDEGALRLLRKNLGQFKRVTLFEGFLGERSEILKANVEDDGGNLRLVPATGEEESQALSVTTLDERLAFVPDRDRYRVLKIDTEGFDCRILRGGMDFVREAKPAIMMEFHPQNMRRVGEDGVETLRLLREAKYQDVVVYDNGGRLLIHTTLGESRLLEDLQEYASSPSGIYYYDFCFFHRDDALLASALVALERGLRGAVVS